MKQHHFDDNMAKLAQIENMNKVWEDALEIAIRLNYKKNAIIPHTQQQGVYYIKKGQVRLSYISPQGHERITLTYNTHSIFNEARVFAGHDATGCFKCVTDVELYLFQKDLLLRDEFIIKYPKIVKNLLATMGAKILLHYSFFVELGTNSNIITICKFIVNLSIKNNNANVFPVLMTQQEVCDLFGMHRATLARTIKKLKEEGIISKFTKKEIVIKNRELLIQLASQQ